MCVDCGDEMSDELDLDAIDAMCAVLTRGYWETDGRIVISEPEEDGGASLIAEVAYELDARLIAEIPTLIPALVARVRELEAENEALAGMIPAKAWVSDRELTPEEYEYGAQIPIPDEVKEML